MTNDDVLHHLGKLARSESDAGPSTQGKDGAASEREDPERAAFMAPLSDEATARILKNVAKVQAKEAPLGILINAPGLGADVRASSDENTTAGAWNRTGITKVAPSFWSRVVHGPALALLLALAMLAGAMPALLSSWFPDPFPPVEVEATLRDGVPLPKEAPIRLASERSDSTVLFRLALAEPYTDPVDAKAFLEKGQTYVLLTTRTAPTGRTEVSVDTGLAGLTNIPDGPARVVIFVGRPGHLPSTPEEAKSAQQPSTSEPRHYRVIVRDVLIGGEATPR